MNTNEAVSDYDSIEVERQRFQTRMAREAKSVAGEEPADMYLYSWPTAPDFGQPIVFSAAFHTELAALRYFYHHRNRENIHIRKPGKDGRYWMVSNWAG